MSKKPRGKSGSAAGGGGNKWEAGLLAATIDEVSAVLCKTISLVANNSNTYYYNYNCCILL